MKPFINTSPILSLVLISTFICFSGPDCSAAETIDAVQWEITADKMTRYEDPPIVIAEGNVILEKKESVTRILRPEGKKRAYDWSELLGEDDAVQDEKAAQEGAKTQTTVKVLTTIKADWIAYDTDLGRIKARGNLLIDIGPDQLTADYGLVDLEHETGTFENTTIVREHKDMHLEGRVVEKTGDLTYHIEDGWIVTCKVKEGETPPWSFAAADTEITDGGYAVLKHATFRIKGVPVLYTPYMILPAKRKRQTGFLFPSFSHSDNGGFGVELPFFINLSPSSDVTLYPQYITERGLMMGAEFRYVSDQNEKGMVMGNYLNDDLSDPSQVEYYQDSGYTHTNQDRYWIRAKADHEFGAWSTRIDLDLASDKDYLTEFNSDLTGFDTSHDKFLDIFGRGFQDKTEFYRENSIEFLRSWDNGTAFQGEFLTINDLNDPDVSPSRLWKLPSLSYTGLIPVFGNSGMDFSWDADYVNYWREDGAGAHRVDLHPQLSMSIPLSKYLDTTVTAGVRDTFYSIQVNGDEDAFEDGDTENRFLADFEMEVGTTMIGDFALNVGNVNSLSHTFRPYVSYEFISEDDNEVISALDLDSVDEIGDKSIFYYGIDNYFSIAGEQEGKRFDRDYGYIKIKQGYDFRSEASDEPLTPIELELAYYPLREARLKYETEIDVYGEGMIAHTVEADYTSGRGDYLSADYKYDKENNIDSISADARLVLPYNFIAGYSIERSLEDGRTIEEELSLIYQQPCWSVELKSYYTPGDQTYMIMFTLANIGTPIELDLPGI